MKAMKYSVAVCPVLNLLFERREMIWRGSGDGRSNRLRFGSRFSRPHSGSRFDEAAKAIGAGRRTPSVGVDGMVNGSGSGSEIVWEEAICFVDCCCGGARAIAAGGGEKASGMNRMRRSRIVFYDGNGHCCSGDSSGSLICRRDGAGFCDHHGRGYRCLSCCCGGCDGVHVSSVPFPLIWALPDPPPSVRAAASLDHSSTPHKQPVPVS